MFYKLLTAIRLVIGDDKALFYAAATVSIICTAHVLAIENNLQ